MKEELVILGSGPAGYAAAIYAARAHVSTTIFSGDLPGGLLTQAAKVANYPGFAEPIPGYELMDKIGAHAEALGAKINYDTVKSIHFAENANVLELQSGESLEARAVVIALGTRHRSLGLAGEKELLGHGLSYCATCDAAFFRNKTVALVAGNNDTALDEALILASSAAEVHVIHKRDAFRDTRIQPETVLSNPKIKMHWNAVVSGLLGVPDGKLSGVELKNTLDGNISHLPCDGLFAAIGLTPNTEILEGTGLLLDEKGFVVLPDPARSFTNLSGVFAAGDCTDPWYRQAIIAAGSGARAGIDALKFLRKTK